MLKNIQKLLFLQICLVKRLQSIHTSCRISFSAIPYKSNIEIGILVDISVTKVKTTIMMNMKNVVCNYYFSVLQMLKRLQFGRKNWYDFFHAKIYIFDIIFDHSFLTISSEIKSSSKRQNIQ